MKGARTMPVVRDAGESIAVWLAEVIRGTMAGPPSERDVYVAKVVKRSMSGIVALAGPDPGAVDLAAATVRRGSGRPKRERFGR